MFCYEINYEYFQFVIDRYLLMWYTLFEIEISRKTCAMLLIVKCLLFMVFYFPFIYQKVGFAHAYFFCAYFYKHGYKYVDTYVWM